MSKDNWCNSLLYILSEKSFDKCLSFSKFKEYINILNPSLNEEKCPYFGYNLFRKLSALGYINILRSQHGKTLQTNSPKLVLLHFIRPIFLFTGARTEDLIDKINTMCKRHSFIFDRKKHNNLPDTITIIPDSLENFKKQWEHSTNKLKDYVELYINPVGEDILNSIPDIVSYKQSLKNNWFSANQSQIQEIFDIKTLKFRPFQEHQKPTHDFLGKTLLYEKSPKYYLFKRPCNEKIEIDLDWGRFVVLAEYSDKDVLQYNKSNRQLTSAIRLPLILERCLSLFYGIYPLEQGCFFIFQHIRFEVAQTVSRKLNQRLIIKE